MTDIKEQPIWKPYPEYPFIQANQFGEIRTVDRYVQVKGQGRRLIQGRVLKQQLNKSGYMYVGFRVNGKYVFLRVHRIVATCFLPNPLGLPEINHIDNDPTNNAVNNLEWCSHKQNIAYREKYGISAKEATKEQRKPVFAVNLETGKVLRFESQNEAARQLGICASNINNVIKGKLNQIHGYWFTEDESEITKEKIQEIKDSMYFLGGVVAVNPETSEVFLFKSQHDASRQLGVNIASINMVIKGKRNKAGGCWFTYTDKNAVENTREKFGDDIAEKVEKLMTEREQEA